MATTEEIAILRIYIAQPEDIEPYTDAILEAVIDVSDTLRLAAAEIWDSKSASVAHLVDISEGGSSRKMSELYDRYVATAARYRGARADVPLAGITQTRPVVRG